MVRYFHNSGHILRFIEFMDVGASNGWCMDDVLPAKDIIDVIQQEFPVEPAKASYGGEVAKRWRFLDGGGEVGVIASVTQPFCRGCTRVRLSAEGQLYTCLFATQGFDLRAQLRDGLNDAELCDAIAKLWQKRDDRYSEIRTFESHLLPREERKIEMSYIGG